MIRIVVPVGVIALIAAFFALGYHEHLTLDAFHEGRESFEAWYELHPWLTLSIYVAVFVLATLFLPIAALMTAVGGALFGFWTGALVASFAAALGATLAFWLSRFVLHDAVQSRFGNRLAAIHSGMAQDGPLYLFSLRLVPVVPFFAINLAMGLTPIKTFTFYWVTQLGMLAGILVYANAGTQLAEVDNLSEVFTPKLIGSLLLLAVFPLAARWLVAIVRARRKRGMTV